MNEKKRKPKIRFAGFTDDWEQRKVSEEVDSIDTGKSKYEAKESGDFEILGSTGIIGYDDSFDYEGDFLLTARVGANAGTLYRHSGKVKITDNTVFLQGKHIDFVFYLLDRFDLKKMSFGSGQPLIKTSELKSLELMMPTKNEEKEKIASYFSNLDNLITLHQRKCDKLKYIKKSMLEKMFPKNGESVPEIRFEGFTNDWEQRKLGELTTYRNGTGHEEKQSDVGKYELVNLNSISIDGGLKPSGKFIDEETETLIKDDLVMVLSDVGHGDLLGRVAIIPENNRFVLNQRVALLRNNDFADIKYLFSYINAHQRYFKLQGAGSSQLNISRESVEKFEVLLPSKDEQKKIGEYFSSLDTLITLHQCKLVKLKNIKKSMLKKMFV